MTSPTCADWLTSWRASRRLTPRISTQIGGIWPSVNAAPELPLSRAMRKRPRASPEKRWLLVFDQGVSELGHPDGLCELSVGRWRGLPVGGVRPEEWVGVGDLAQARAVDVDHRETLVILGLVLVAVQAGEHQPLAVG